MSIQGFRGEYRWLSNFAPSKVKFNGIKFSTVEHAYQAAKSLNVDVQMDFAKLPKPGDAKKAGRHVSLRPDWEGIKLQIMEDLVRQKFQIPDLKKLLLDTGDQLLEETNDWNDTFWGVCNSVGDNHLGKILMKIREELRNDKT